MEKRIFTKPSEILVGIWTEGENGALVAPTSENTLNLTSVIADSLTVTQGDPETTDIDSETSDEPIYSVSTAGKYTLELNNASIDEDFLTKVMGWIKDGDNIIAPQSYAARYIAVQVKFTETSAYLYAPKLLIAPKLVFESLSSNIAYGTISGTASSAKIGSGANAKEGSLAIIKEAILTMGAA